MAITSTSRQILALSGWLALSFAAAALGAVASVDAGEFYEQLARPGWAPPKWLFGPVWTILYMTMGVAAWLVWRAHGFERGRTALIIFIIQLGVNALWSWVFFVWRQGAFAFAEVMLLWCLVVATVVSFWRLHRVAGGLLLPYLAWVTFASALTYSTWRLNPDYL